ncbi:MAG TPA: HD domain-containing protein [Geobacteraceae bacterium]
MTPADLAALYRWFTGYSATFRTANLADQRNYDLKEAHTYRVWSNSRLIASDADFSAEERLLGEAVALLHDIGRFRQYREYGTFRDSDSVNHAELGVAIMREGRVLAGLSAADQELIELAVGLHNVFVIPADLSPAAGAAVALIRDADKLDIWRVFSELFALDPAERASAATLGLAETSEVTPQVLEMLISKQMVNLALVKTVNDYKLLLLSWVYDLSYAATARLVAKRRLIDRVALTLPTEPSVTRGIATVRQEIAVRGWEDTACTNSASSA